MKMFTRVLSFMVLGFACVECVVLSGRAFFCRDPDSGKLHAVNTTWPSESFCGNYTCKLRKKNMTQTEYTPLRQINITNIEKADAENQTVIFNTKVQPDIISILHKKSASTENTNNFNSVELELMNVEKNIMNTVRKDNFQSHDYSNSKASYEKMNHNNDAKPQTIASTSQEYRKPDSKHNTKMIQVVGTTNNNDPSDRYLTENEINTIAEVLHTVKKSDLDAIVDIYNLAQDIYNEMDTISSSENLVDETINTLKHEQSRRHSKPKSYWYDPLASKGKVVDKYDLDLGATMNVPTMTTAKSTPARFNDKISSKEFSKVPSNYPITDFQRLSSYLHVPSNNVVSSKQEQKLVRKVSKEHKHCDNEKHKHVYKEEDYRRVIQPSYLLPYPFTYVHHYNITDLPTFYYNNPSWRLDYYNRYRYYQPYYNAFIAQVPTIISMPSEEVQDSERSPVNKIQSHELILANSDELSIPQETKPVFDPEWKTGPIPKEDLERVRAKIDTGKIIKAFPLRKLVKLEKVGTLNKVDENKLDVRHKRSPDNKSSSSDKLKDHEVEYEAYLDRITCKTQTVPGYFRIGNLSHPFPHCCPQLIKKPSN